MTDRYEIIGPIGSGGMATVWRARDRELDRVVAIKRPHPAPVGSPTHERFRREARAAAAVSHPNLVTIHDAAVDDAGPYLVMEFVDAPTLAEAQVLPDDIVAIGASLARALAALHASNLVHRDVKPANILVAPGGAQLTDFGIARSLDSSDDVTRTGVNLGTPSYAPPESLAGRPHGQAGDVYSLAVVIHEMSTGERFATAGTTRAMVADPGLRDVLESALADDPSVRPSAARFAESLESLDGSPAHHDRTREMTGSSPILAPTSDENTALDMIGGPVGPAAVSGLQRRWDEADRSGRSLVVLLSAGALLAVALLVFGVVRGDDRSTVPDPTADGDVAPVETGSTEPDEAAADPPVGQPVPAETQPVPAETQPVPAETEPAAAEPAPAPVDTGAAPVEPAPPAPAEPEPAEVEPAVVPDAEVTFDDFERFVSELPDDVLREKERERVIDDVEDAIDEARDGDVDDAQKDFDSAVRRLGRTVSDESSRSRSLQLLVDLASSVGVVVET